MNGAFAGVAMVSYQNSAFCAHPVLDRGGKADGRIMLALRSQAPAGTRHQLPGACDASPRVAFRLQREPPPLFCHWLVSCRSVVRGARGAGLFRDHAASTIIPNELSDGEGWEAAERPSSPQVSRCLHVSG